jgi:hypothetical protein
MDAIKNECLQQSYIGQKTAENLAVDYDENQLLVKEFSNKVCHWSMEALPDVK